MTGQVSELLSELKAGLVQLYGDRLRGCYLYGSYARNEQHDESDFDVLIVLDDVVDYYGEIKRTGFLASELSGKYGVSISSVFVSEAEWLGSSRSFFRSVRRDATAA